MNKSKMYNLIYRLRKSGGIRIKTRERLILYAYRDAGEEGLMQDKRIVSLCKEFGFARQAEIR